MAQAWTDLPLDQPIIVEGPTASTLALSIEPLPADGPAVITYAAAAPRRATHLIDDLLARLDLVARELFPAWLPAAAAIDDPAGAGAVAVRSIALRAAAAVTTMDRSWPIWPSGRCGKPLSHNRFMPEIRAAELAKVIARSFGRGRTAILMACRPG